MSEPSKALLKEPLKPRGTDSDMAQYTEADVDARGTDCQCCGEPLEKKGPRSRLCSDCITEGCDPSTSLCLKELGDPSV